MTSLLLILCSKQLIEKLTQKNYNIKTNNMCLESGLLRPTVLFLQALAGKFPFAPPIKIFLHLPIGYARPSESGKLKVIMKLNFKRFF